MRVALIGDFNESVTAHHAIPAALRLEAEAMGREIEGVWLGTDMLTDPAVLDGFDAGWAVPASPYASFDNALAAIRYLRESEKPFLGTCGGYQHALVEFARSVLGYEEAGISEIDPGCGMPLVSTLSCALIDETDAVVPEPGGLIAKACGEGHLSETYRCSFGLNPAFSGIFDGSAMRVEARDPDGAVRAMSLTGHPFFMGTAFQPERTALAGQRHPVISSFLAAASVG